MSQTLTLSARLPVLGARSWTLPLPAALSDTLSDAGELVGGSVKAAVSVKESADGISLGVTASMPWGPEELDKDVPLGVFEREVADRLLALDGGEIECSVAVSGLAVG